MTCSFYLDHLMANFHPYLGIIGPGGGGTCKDFDRDAHVIVSVCNLIKCHFLGFSKFPSFFGVERIAVIF